jgi:hypothetical protein
VQDLIGAERVPRELADRWHRTSSPLVVPAEYRSSRRDAASDVTGTAQNASISAAKALQSIVASVNTERRIFRVSALIVGDET